MKSGMDIFAGLLIVAGGIFTLQGANILPGSWMTGKIEWFIIGTVMIGIAIGLLIRSNRQNKPDA